MVLSKQMVVEIQKFIDDEDWNLGAFEDALIRTLVQFRFHDVREWWSRIFEDFIGVDLGTALKVTAIDGWNAQDYLIKYFMNIRQKDEQTFELDRISSNQTRILLAHFLADRGKGCPLSNRLHAAVATDLHIRG